MIDELNAEFIGILDRKLPCDDLDLGELLHMFELLVLLLCEDAVWPNAQVGSMATAPAAAMAQKSGDSFINRINSLLKLKKVGTGAVSGFQVKLIHAIGTCTLSVLTCSHGQRHPQIRAADPEGPALQPDCAAQPVRRAAPDGIGQGPAAIRSPAAA